MPSGSGRVGAAWSRPRGARRELQESSYSRSHMITRLGECGDRVRVGHAVGRAKRRDPHANAAAAPDADHRGGYLTQQPGPVAGGSALLIVAPVGAVAPGLVEQVAVARVDRSGDLPPARLLVSGVKARAVFGPGSPPGHRRGLRDGSAR